MNDDCRIFYLMSGPAHLPYLVVSLYTLRSHWAGEVLVYAWPESYRIVRRIEQDGRLGICARPREPAYRGKNAQFLDKIRLAQRLAFGCSLYLDADTTVHGDLSALFDAAREVGFACTQFCGWTTGGSVVRARIHRLRQFPAIDQDLVSSLLCGGHVSVNGGVWASLATSPVLPLWEHWTWVARSVFIADEAVLHVVTLKLAKHLRILDGRYNCSPIRKWQPWPDEEVVVRHYHGDSNVRPNKSPEGHAQWWPLYQECLEQNVGGVREWIGGIPNRWLKKLETADAEA